MNKPESNTMGLYQDEELNRKIDERVKKLFQTELFIQRKLTDTPTDALSVVNRKYVNLNGSVAGRPVSSVANIGQFYIDTGTNIPMWKVTAGWVNGVGSIVALNN
jgi:hypothetical protein